MPRRRRRLLLRSFPSLRMGMEGFCITFSLLDGGKLLGLLPMRIVLPSHVRLSSSGYISIMLTDIVNAALKPLSAGKLPSQSNAPNGANALVANYPAGTFGLTGSGYSFYSEGSHNGVLTSGAKEVLFSYSIYFENGFDFVKGGKLPGLYGGTNIDVAKSCSGGRQDGRDECFSARMMWRTDGAGEFYNYYPTSIQQGNGYCQTAPYSICDTTYGDSSKPF